MSESRAIHEAGKKVTLCDADPVAEEHLAFERQYHRTAMWEVVYEAVERGLTERGWTRADLARRLNKDPAVISRCLNHASNWTIDTLVDLLVAVDAEPRLSVVFNYDSDPRIVPTQNFQWIQTAPKNLSQTQRSASIKAGTANALTMGVNVHAVRVSSTNDESRTSSDRIRATVDVNA